MIEKFGIKRENDDGTFFTRIGLEPTHAKMFGVKDTDEIYRVTFEVHEDQSEPDWNKSGQLKYVLICMENNIIKYAYAAINAIRAFPTEEMRDAFYENFKDLIEECKEFL